MTSIGGYLGRWVVRYRWWIILLTIPAVGITAAGLSRLTISNNTRVFFGEHNPDYQALKALEETYSRTHGLVFILAPAQGTIFTREALTAVSELTESAWNIPYSLSVSSIANFPQVRAEGDDLIVENLVSEPASLTEAQIKQIERTALSEPAIVKSILSPDGRVTTLHVNLILPPGRSQAVPEVASYARAIADEFRVRHPRIDIYLTGSVIIDQAFAEASTGDLTRLFPAAFVVMTALVAVALRSFYGTLSAVSVTVLSMMMAVGLTGWLGVPLNAVSVGAPGLILTLAVADNIHILATMFHLIRQGRTRHEAIAESLRINFKAIFLASVTTIIGFLSMNFSESPPFRDLGNIVGTGVTIDFLNSILLLPALLAVLPISPNLHREKTPWIDHNRLAGFVIQRRGVLLWVVLAVVAVAGMGIPRIELDDNFLTYFDDTFEFRRATDFMMRHIGGWDAIEYSLRSGQSSGITDPCYMEAVDRFAQWCRRQPKVVRVYTVVDTIKRLHRDMHGGDESYYRIPDRRDLAAQYLLFLELSLPEGRDLNSQIDVDKSATRFTVILESISAKELCHTEETFYQWLQANAPDPMVARGTGLSLIWARITQRNIRAMLWASFTEVLLISGIMVFAIRSLKFTVIFLIPNLVPAFMAFGIWGLTKGRVGLALSVVVAMTLGIIVDDTIHFFVTYFRARREQGMSPDLAIRHAFETVGSAIGITTLVLASGFMVMTLSHYKMSSEMGLMCAMVIGLALVVEYFLSPTLLMKADRKPDKLTK